MSKKPIFENVPKKKESVGLPMMGPTHELPGQESFR